MSGAEPVYMLLHVPKCAGSTIQAHLRAHCRPGAFWQPDQRPRPWRYFGRGYAASDMPDPAGLRAMSGHYIGHSLERYFPGREIRRTVLLRDPVGFHVSRYNFRMTLYLRRKRRTYSFKLAMRSLQRDPIIHFLLYRWLEIPWGRILLMSAQEKLDRVSNALAEFWFVGAYTDCDRLVAALAPDLDVPARAVRHKDSAEWVVPQAADGRPQWQPVVAAQLPETVRRQILADNALDQLLWETWRHAGFEPSRIRRPEISVDGRPAFIAAELMRPAFEVTRRLLRR